MLRRRRKDDSIRMITMLGSSYGRVIAMPSMDMAVGEDYVEKTTSKHQRERKRAQQTIYP